MALGITNNIHYGIAASRAADGGMGGGDWGNLHWAPPC